MLKRILYHLGLASITLTCAVSASNAATDLRMLVAWNPGLSIVDFPVNLIIKEVETTSRGDMKIGRLGPAVVPSFEQLEPTSKGVFDLHFGAAPYHAGASAVGLILDTVVTDVEKRRQTGVWDWMDRYYQKTLNVKLLMISAEPGYQILLKAPIGPDGGLKGRKIRSNPAYDQIIVALGGSPVQLGPQETYAGLEKGVADGVGWPQHSVIALKYNEVTRYFTRPSFGGAELMWMMNLDKWNKLTPTQQKILIDVGYQVERQSYENSKRIAAEEEKAMIAKGMQATGFGSDQTKKLEAIFNEGIWERAVKRSGKDAEAFISFIKEKGVVRQ